MQLTGCGAVPGEPCAPGCPSLAADPNELSVSVVPDRSRPAVHHQVRRLHSRGQFPRLDGDAARRLVTVHSDHTGEVTR
jgi:hypothetical protein